MNKTEQAVAVFNKYASSYERKYMNVDLYADTFDFFCNKITNRHAKVLEIACGPGNVTRYLLDKRPDLDILATDLAPNMLQIAKMNNPETRIMLLDCKKIKELQEKFDAIMCGFCLPYLSKEEVIQLIADAYDILKPNGVLYISTMEDDYSKSGYQKSSNGDELYVHYHEAGYLVEAMEKKGFKVDLVERKDYHQPDGSITKDLVIVSEK